MVDATPKRPEVFLENAAFYLSFFLLAIIVGVFFYVRYSNSQKNAELDALAAQEVKMKTEEQKILEYEVKSARRRLADFSQIMASRKSSARFFDKLESLVAQGVYFSACELDFPKMSAGLTGHGKTFSDVGRQAMKFEAAGDALRSSAFGRIAASETGGVDFTVDVLFEPETKSFEYTGQDR